MTGSAARNWQQIFGGISQDDGGKTLFTPSQETKLVEVVKAGLTAMAGVVEKRLSQLDERLAVIEDIASRPDLCGVPTLPEESAPQPVAFSPDQLETLQNVMSAGVTGMAEVVELICPNSVTAFPTSRHIGQLKKRTWSGT